MAVTTISIGLGEQVVSKDPSEILVAYGLGSCLGIGMYDPRSRVGGMVHAVLPEHLNPGEPKSPKYVDWAILTLLEKMVAAGADKNRIVVRMAGGANMLINSSLSNTFDIGTRNISMARQTLQRLSMRLSSEDVGGNIGRTVRFYVETGRMTVRMIGGVERDL
jgi:chemotaxis protein CheD